MNGASISSPAKDAVPESANFTPGMAALVRGGTNTKPLEPAGSAPAVLPASRRGTGLRRASLLVADALLVSLAWRLVLKTESPLGFPTLALCAAAIGLGAWLFWLACSPD